MQFKCEPTASNGILFWSIHGQGRKCRDRTEADILVATTIIESGLDIPNANTIFINQAENYGLADLHQLRGRVGRVSRRAYAYLLLERRTTRW